VLYIKGQGQRGKAKGKGVGEAIGKSVTFWHSIWQGPRGPKKLIFHGRCLTRECFEGFYMLAYFLLALLKDSLDAVAEETVLGHQA